MEAVVCSKEHTQKPSRGTGRSKRDAFLCLDKGRCRRGVIGTGTAPVGPCRLQPCPPPLPPTPSAPVLRAPMFKGLEMKLLNLNENVPRGLQGVHAAPRIAGFRGCR